MTADTTPGADDLRRSNLELAQTLAPGWERRRAFVEGVATPVREWLVRELRPRPGDTVLELAAGAGDTGFEVATQLGEQGRLISSDFSPAMVEVARRRGRERGVENVHYRVIDAEDVELDTDSVDGVVCRYGYMLMVDPAAALRETRRVLRPGGRLVAAVWGAPDRNPFFATMARALVEAGHLPPPDPQAPGVFNLAIQDRTRRLIEEAGFADVRIEDVPVRFAFGQVADYVDVAADTAGPIALVLRGLGDGERRTLEAALEERLAPFAVEDGYELPGLTLCAVAE